MPNDNNFYHSARHYVRVLHYVTYIHNMPNATFGSLDFFGKFLNFFSRNFFGGIIVENFFGRISFGRILFGGFFGRIFWEGIG